MHRPKSLGLVCALILASAAQGHAGKASPAFEKLKALAGNWEGKMEDGHTANINYRVSSGGSVVVETSMPGEPGEMMTVFHPDGDSLMATHYCGAHNQPRMRASGLSADGNELAFRFLDITNLASPDAEHMREVTYHFKDADHFTTVWTSREKGKDTLWTFTYTRKK